jgi:outer membrane protein TolC
VADVQQNRLKFAALVVCALLTTYAISQAPADKKPAAIDKLPPYQIPLLDGKKDRTKAQPTEEYKLAEAPNARELFDMIVSCWPERSWFRGELSAEARSMRRNSAASGQSTTTLDPVSGNYITQNSTGNDATIGLLLRVPLWSATELDREREREANRRNIISAQVGTYVSALAEYQITEREMQITKALEKRSQERVALGIADTSEQVQKLQSVSQLESKQLMNRANLIKSRITLQGLCTHDKAWIIDEYLKRFRDVE